MKNVWLSIPLIILMNSGCTATMNGIRSDTIAAGQWTQQQIDNTRRVIHNSTRE